MRGSDAITKTGGMAQSKGNLKTPSPLLSLHFPGEGGWREESQQRKPSWLGN